MKVLDFEAEVVRSLWRSAVLAPLVGLLLAPARPEAEGARLFRERVAPILERRCVSCHGGTSPKGRLSLTTAPAALAGGASGPAVVPGKPDLSLLVEMIAGDEPEMPQKGEKLSPDDVASLRAWIAQGAPWPEGLTLSERKFVGERWWAFEPLKRPPVPAVSNARWLRTPVDAFVLKALDAKGLAPGPEADRRTLIRRLTYDLHGLPPTPEEVDDFLGDRRPTAYDALVDRLLASPRYGERWGRHWLDVARYGDTHGYDKDKRRDHAWPYRDYVIRSFNEDVPYGRFVAEQVAGDILAPGDSKGIVATGFIAAGPWDFVGHVELREGTVDKAKARLLDRDDMVTGVFTAFQSLTVGCARCHDHKFDPISQKEYYRLQAVFAGVERGDRAGDNLPAAKVYSVVPHAPRPIHLLARGDVESPGETVTPGALSCVPGLDPSFASSGTDDEGTRRAALARWLASPANVLTWRSIANRVWHHHFGRGIVDTPSDFGRNGSMPTHPELLDWLAVELRENGQSLKALHRTIVRSATYRQSSRDDPAALAIDADARYLWRVNRRRLDAESIRDSVLAVAGVLDPGMGGPGFEPFRFKDDHSPVYDHADPGKIDDPKARRRAVYRFAVRSVPDPFLDCLDGADPNVATPVRSTTITALQALALWNDLFMLKQSERFAGRVQAQEHDPMRQVELAYRLALGRRPRAAERAELAAFAARHGLPNACRVLLNSNEFVFVD